MQPTIDLSRCKLEGGKEIDTKDLLKFRPAWHKTLRHLLQDCHSNKENANYTSFCGDPKPGNFYVSDHVELVWLSQHFPCHWNFLNALGPTVSLFLLDCEGVGPVQIDPRVPYDGKKSLMQFFHDFYVEAVGSFEGMYLLGAYGSVCSGASGRDQVDHPTDQQTHYQKTSFRVGFVGYNHTHESRSKMTYALHFKVQQYYGDTIAGIPTTTIPDETFTAQSRQHTRALFSDKHTREGSRLQVHNRPLIPISFFNKDMEEVKQMDWNEFVRYTLLDYPRPLVSMTPTFQREHQAIQLQRESILTSPSKANGKTFAKRQWRESDPRIPSLEKLISEFVGPTKLFKVFDAALDGSIWLLITIKSQHALCQHEHRYHSKADTSIMMKGQKLLINDYSCKGKKGRGWVRYSLTPGQTNPFLCHKDQLTLAAPPPPPNEPFHFTPCVAVDQLVSQRELVERPTVTSAETLTQFDRQTKVVHTTFPWMVSLIRRMVEDWGFLFESVSDYYVVRGEDRQFNILVVEDLLEPVHFNSPMYKHYVFRHSSEARCGDCQWPPSAITTFVKVEQQQQQQPWQTKQPPHRKRPRNSGRA